MNLVGDLFHKHLIISPNKSEQSCYNLRGSTDLLTLSMDMKILFLITGTRNTVFGLFYSSVTGWK